MSIGTKDPIVNITGGEMSTEEANEYVRLIQGKYFDRIIKEINIHIDGDSVDIKTVFDDTKPFNRIRRITGYLVGTLDRFNDGKRSEEHDRVKHTANE